MPEVTTLVPTSPENVFAVLADGWSYVGWVVGATHIRAVDDGWPQVGTRIHHSLGAWPATVNDVTIVRAVEPQRMLELEARLWPFGTALVRLELTEKQPDVTEVRMSERVIRGPGRLLPNAAQALLLVPRNRESLRRLCDRARGREQARQSGTSG
ncbi:SRPBCC family protein [Actinophytocola sp.]|uniref:SRPBCC family protein n=1 Tax=Actinophytocola sp. TaxID=1872138 RepID=UPI003899FD95